MTDSVTRDYRSKLLTRRVRAIIRAFNKNPKYLSDEKPNITWDELFIPPELYVNLKRELESLDAQQVQKRKESKKEKEGKKEKMQEKEKGEELEKKEREKKARESQRRKVEEQIAKEKARVAQSDKDKAKNTSQEKKNPNKTEKIGRAHV